MNSTKKNEPTAAGRASTATSADGIPFDISEIIPTSEEYDEISKRAGLKLDKIKAGNTAVVDAVDNDISFILPTSKDCADAAKRIELKLKSEAAKEGQNAKENCCLCDQIGGQRLIKELIDKMDRLSEKLDRVLALEDGKAIQKAKKREKAQGKAEREAERLTALTRKALKNKLIRKV